MNQSKKKSRNMALKTTYPHIEKPNGESARLIEAPRIRVAQVVMDYLAHGWSAEEMCRQHPNLTPAQVHAAMTYYFDHQQEIEGEIEQEVHKTQQDRQGHPRSPFLDRMRSEGKI